MTKKQQIDKIYKDIENNINSLSKKLYNEANKKIKELTKGTIFCKKDTYCLKYSKKQNEVKFGDYGCNDYVNEKDFYIIEVEDYRRIQTYTDAGYGDDDCFKYEHTLTKYKVCPKCGRCKLLDEEILDCSNEWSRSNWEQKCPVGYIPFKWKPIIKIIKGKKK